MLERSRGLPRDALTAIADLERHVVAADGGRLKLEWATLRSRSGEQTRDVLWWDGDQLVGFAGLYSYGPSSVEVTGMVHPVARGRGIGAALLRAVLDLAKDLDLALDLDRGTAAPQVLLVVPRPSAAGRALALRHDAVLEHSEHALELTSSPAQGPTDPGVMLRPATPADVPALTRMLAEAFGHSASDVAQRLSWAGGSTLAVETAGVVVGTMRITRERHEAGVNGFALDAPWRGRGIGTDVLRRACLQLREQGARRITLDVAVDNDRALRLYTGLGFVPVTTEDYYALPSRSSRSSR